MGKIQKCESLKVADAVLRHLNKIKIADAVSKSCYIDTFDNCREQGYRLHYWGMRAVSADDVVTSDGTIFWAQNRNSDSIVVYHNNSYQTMPSDAGWKSAEYFNSGEYSKAAKYIHSIIDRWESELAKQQKIGQLKLKATK